VITDPIFYLLALPAIALLGLGKGGFAGIGMAAAPLLSLYIPPLQAAAVLLPILLCQDAISVWTYRRDWDAWNVKVMMAGAVFGLGAAWVFAAFVSDAAIRLTVGLIGMSFVLNAWFRRPKLVAPTVRAACSGRRRSLHVDVDPGRRAALFGLCAAAAAAQNDPGRHHDDLLRADQRHEDRSLPCARPVLDRDARHLGAALAARGGDQLRRHLAGPGDARRGVLPHCVLAGAGHSLALTSQGAVALLRG